MLLVPATTSVVDETLDGEIVLLSTIKLLWFLRLGALGQLELLPLLLLLLVLLFLSCNVVVVLIDFLLEWLLLL